MARNKIIYGNETLIDLTSDTATPNDVAQGITFHDKSGNLQVGTNSGVSSWVYTIAINAPIGADISVTGGSEFFNITSAGEEYAFNVHAKNTLYTITVEYNGTVVTDIVTTTSVDGEISHFDYKFGIVNVHINNGFLNKDIKCIGPTIDVTKQSDAALTISFSVPSVGRYNIQAYYNVSTLESVWITVEDLDVPVDVTVLYKANGHTVTPINDVQTWLSCIGVDDSEYTTLEEVLEDEDLLWDLLDDINSINYLVRSTQWAEEICDNYDAILHLNAYEEAWGILSEDSTWANFLQQWEQDRSKVPIMTSNIEPSGECFASSESSTTYAAWKAFDDNSSSTYWRATNSTVPSYVGYRFEQPTYINKIKIQFSSSSYYASKFIVQGSNDGETWQDLSDELTVKSSTATTLTEYDLNGLYKFEYYRIYITALASSYNAARVGYLELWYVGEGQIDSINSGVRDWIHSMSQNVEIPFNHYVLLDEVLNDSELLKCLLSENSGIAYLSDKIGWAEIVENNENAMKVISSVPDILNNSKLWYYDEWKSALFGSPYRDYIFINAVPIMTSDTEPQGECFVTDGYTPTESRKAYKGFDGSEYSYARLIASNVENYIGYDFGEDNSVKAIGFKILVGDSETASITTGRTYKIQGSNDKLNWTDLAIFENPTSTTLGEGRKWEDYFERDTAYRYFRAWFSAPVYSSSNAYVRDFEIYIRSENEATTQILIQSAPLDEVYYLDDNDNKVILCHTNDAGIGYASKGSLPPVGLNYIYSTVARDKNDYSKDYSALVRIKENTTEINLIPEEFIYWYGIKGNVEKCIGSNGWSSPSYSTTEVISLSASLANEDKFILGLSKTVSGSGTTASPYSVDFGAFGTKNQITSNGSRDVYVVYESKAQGDVPYASTKKCNNDHYTTMSGNLPTANDGRAVRVIITRTDPFYLYVTNIGSSSSASPGQVRIKAMWVE